MGAIVAALPEKPDSFGFAPAFRNLPVITSGSE